MWVVWYCVLLFGLVRFEYKEHLTGWRCYLFFLCFLREAGMRCKQYAGHTVHEVCACVFCFVCFVSGKEEKALKKCVSVFICGEKVVFLALVCWKPSFCYPLYNWTFSLATWLILPVVIRSSQRLSHACLSINPLLWNCERLIISVIIYLIVPYYLDNRSNSRANTCVDALLGCIY